MICPLIPCQLPTGHLCSHWQCPKTLHLHGLQCHLKLLHPLLLPLIYHYWGMPANLWDPMSVIQFTVWTDVIILCTGVNFTPVHRIVTSLCVIMIHLTSVDPTYFSVSTFKLPYRRKWGDHDLKSRPSNSLQVTCFFLNIFTISSSWAKGREVKTSEERNLTDKRLTISIWPSRLSLLVLPTYISLLNMYLTLSSSWTVTAWAIPHALWAAPGGAANIFCLHASGTLTHPNSYMNS